MYLTEHHTVLMWAHISLKLLNSYICTDMQQPYQFKVLFLFIKATVDNARSPILKLIETELKNQLFHPMQVTVHTL